MVENTLEVAYALRALYVTLILFQACFLYIIYFSKFGKIEKRRIYNVDDTNVYHFENFVQNIITNTHYTRIVSLNVIIDKK